MKSLVIAKNSFLEHLRDRFVLIVLFVAIFLIGFSLVLGSMSFDEGRRVLLHFGLLGIHLSCIGLAIFLGSFVLQKEIERQTCLLTLVRPLSRFEFIIGKWMGVLILQLVVWLILTGLLYFLLLASFGLTPFLQASSGILLESTVLLSFTMCVSLFIRPAVALFSGVGVFLVGHWQKDLLFFAEKSKNASFQIFAQTVDYIFPQLHRMNWRSFYLLENNLIGPQYLGALLHALCWSGLLLTLANWKFRRKDLV